MIPHENTTFLFEDEGHKLTDTSSKPGLIVLTPLFAILAPRLEILGAMGKVSYMHQLHVQVSRLKVLLL